MKKSAKKTSKTRKKPDTFEDRLRRVQEKRTTEPMSQVSEPKASETISTEPSNDPITVGCDVCTEQAFGERSQTFMEPLLALSLTVAVGAIGRIEARCPGCKRKLVLTTRGASPGAPFAVEWPEPDVSPVFPPQMDKFGQFLDHSWVVRWFYRKWEARARALLESGCPSGMGAVEYRQATRWKLDPIEIGDGRAAKLAAEELIQENMLRDIRSYWRRLVRKCLNALPVNTFYIYRAGGSLRIRLKVKY